MRECAHTCACTHDKVVTWLLPKDRICLEPWFREGSKNLLGSCVAEPRRAVAQPCIQALSCCSVQSLLSAFHGQEEEGWPLTTAVAGLLALLLGRGIADWLTGYLTPRRTVLFTLCHISIPTGAYVAGCWVHTGLAFFSFSLESKQSRLRCWPATQLELRLSPRDHLSMASWPYSELLEAPYTCGLGD